MGVITLEGQGLASLASPTHHSVLIPSFSSRRRLTRIPEAMRRRRGNEVESEAISQVSKS